LHSANSLNQKAIGWPGVKRKQTTIEGFMGVEQLEGKRTGRPRGRKSRPRWQRDLEWAYRHLGQDVEPSSAGAKYFLDLAKERPGEFLACLAQLDKVSDRKPESSAPATMPAEQQEPIPAIAKVAQKPMRAKMAFLSLDRLGLLLKGAERVVSLPDDTKVIAASLDRGRCGLVLTLRSSSFPLVDAGQPIPQLEFGR
jgi:hypothetical protein